MPRDNIEDLSRSVATGSDIFTIMTETNAADDTLVLKSVDEIDVKHTRNFWVENGEPIRVDLLLMVRKTLEIKLRKSIANSTKLLSWVTCWWMSNLR